MIKWQTILFFVGIALIVISCESEEQQVDINGLWKVTTIERDKLTMPPSGLWYEIANGAYSMGYGKEFVDSGVVAMQPDGILAIKSKIKADNDSEWAISTKADTVIWNGTDTKVNSNGLKMYLVQTKNRPQKSEEAIIGKWTVLQYTQDSARANHPFGDWIEFYEGGKCLFHPSDSGTWTMNPHLPIMNIQCPSRQLLNQWLVKFDEDKTFWTGTSTFKQDNLKLELKRLE